MNIKDLLLHMILQAQYNHNQLDCPMIQALSKSNTYRSHPGRVITHAVQPLQIHQTNKLGNDWTKIYSNYNIGPVPGELPR